MKTTGLKGKYTPMNRATPAQIAKIEMLRVECSEVGCGWFEVRYPSYIGPGCAAERGAITVVADGMIMYNVELDGTCT